MYRAAEPGEPIHNPSRREWRLLIDLEAPRWELRCYVGNIALARIEVNEHNRVEDVVLGDDYQVDGEEVSILPRGGSFESIEEAMASVEAFLKLNGTV